MSKNSLSILPERELPAVEEQPAVRATIADLDRIIHEPARLAILTVLSAFASADFTFLQTATGLTKGNLSVQITRLEEADMVTVERTFKGKRTQTMVQLTNRGRGRLSRYWEQMEQIRDHTRVGSLSSEKDAKSGVVKQPVPAQG